MDFSDKLAQAPQDEVVDALVSVINEHYAGTMLKNNGNFGFIKQDNGEADMFVMPAACEARVLPAIGARLSYTVTTDDKTGQPRAENVQDARIAALNSGTGDQRGGTMLKNNGSFGFIKQDNGEPDMFVMPQGCDGGLLPPNGVRVSFTITTDEKTGRPRAENVWFEGPLLCAPPVFPGTWAMGNDMGAASNWNMGNGYGAARPGRATSSGNGNSLCVPWQAVNRGGSAGMRSQPYTTPNAHGQNQFGQNFAGANSFDEGAQPFDQNQFGQDSGGAMPGELRLGTMFRDHGGFGFIKQESVEGPDMFIMPAACSAFGGCLPALGVKVQYYVVNDSKTGRPRAEGASPVSI